MHTLQIWTNNWYPYCPKLKTTKGELKLQWCIYVLQWRNQKTLPSIRFFLLNLLWITVSCCANRDLEIMMHSCTSDLLFLLGDWIDLCHVCFHMAAAWCYSENDKCELFSRKMKCELALHFLYGTSEALERCFDLSLRLSNRRNRSCLLCTLGVPWSSCSSSFRLGFDGAL